MATLTEIKNQFAQNSVSNPTNNGLSGLLTDNQRQAALTRYQKEQEEKAKNNGGFFGGIGYAFEKIGLGFLQSIEGIWDFAAGGLADLFGAHDWAEKQLANDWVNYNHADEWFNPSEGWQFVGDVAGGIGTSLPALSAVGAAAAIAFFSGGTLAPVSAALIGGAVAGFGAAGTATKEAYRETGQLTGKEWGYGALSGFTEGVMEGVSDAIGFGMGSIAKGIAKSTAKEGAKQVGKQVAKSVARQTFGKAILGSFLSEAFEEGVQELLDPVWKRITYDPNAENATFQQVAYAALVGGLSGAIMGGADVTVRNSINYFGGSRINKNGGVNGVISLAETIAQTEGVNQSGNAQVDFVVNTLTELQESMKKTNGEVKTAKQKMLVGILSKANTAAPMSIVVSQNADAIVHDAETTVKRLNDIGYKTSDGAKVTVEMLKKGVTGERGTREYRRSLSEAMRNNEALRTVAVMSAAGQLNMDAARFTEQTLRGEQLFNQADLNHFNETATEAQKRDVGDRLGITDWTTVTADELKSRIVDYSTNGGLDQYINERNEVEKLKKLDISKKGLPKYVGNITQDGAVRYKFGDASVAIVKNGDTYLVYDYARDVISKPLSKKEANRVIKEIYVASTVSETSADVRTVTESQQQTQELDTFARENVPDYKRLVGAQQQAVRQTLRQARAAKVSEADQILYASVAARSGANIEFVSAETLGANADAGYSMKDGKILVNRDMANNPKARTAAKILLHEFTHAMIGKGYSVKGKKGKRYIENKVLNDFFTTAIKGLTHEQQLQLLTPYIERHGITMQDFLDGKVDISIDTYIELREELAAHFVERELGNAAALKRIISDKPMFKDKLLAFLKRAKSDYSSNKKLSRAAKALLKKYQKFFNQYATQTRFSPTVTGDVSAYQKTETVADTGTKTRLAMSETDSQGRTLTAAQRKFFSESKVVDENGHLLVVYHGTRNADFFTFQYDKSRQTGTDFGEAYYFTTNLKNAKGYAKDNHKDPRVKEYDAKREALKKQILSETDLVKRKELEQQFYNVKVDGKSLMEILYDVEYDTGGAVRSVYLNLKNPLIVDAKGEYYYKVYPQYFEQARTEGRDGIIVKNVNDSSYYGVGISDVYIAFEKNQIKLTSNQKPTTNTDIRYALPETDSTGKSLSERQRKFFRNSKFVDSDGRLLTLYHQTAADFTVFDTSIKGAGQHDYLTPFGIFMKPSAKNIGIKGNVQMALYGNVTNPIEFADRAALEQYLRDTAHLGEQIDAIKNIDAEYQTKCDIAEKRYTELATRAYYDSENKILQGQVSVAEREWSAVIDEWGKAFDKRSSALKDVVNAYFRKTQYDGIILRQDGGSFGRETAAYIAFEPNQVKNVSNTSPTNSVDIRFALSGEELQQRVIAAQDMRDEARGYKKRLKINSDGSVTVYHGTSAKNAQKIRTTGVINEQSYFATNAGEAYYYAHIKNKGGVILEIHADARALEFAAAGAEIYAPKKLTKIDGVYVADDIRYALPDLEQEAVTHFGHTYKWVETGYILTDGSRLDFSGRNEGASGGYRTIDHRDVRLISSYDNLSGTDALIDFMRRGNIRIMAETNGINLSVLPTKAQENALSDFISKNRGEIMLDIDNTNGDTVVSVEYPRGTHYSKILQDIKNYFNNGTMPVVSELSKFRYALSETDSQGHTLTSEQRAFFNESKVVDDNGRLLPMYHGSKSKFYTFNMLNRGKNGAIYGVGYYFTADMDDAKRYGKNVVNAYLNIKKPVSLYKLSISKSEWGTFLQYANKHLDEYISPNEWQGNRLFVDSELNQYSHYNSDVELIRQFINGISAGNQTITEAYLKMLTDSIGYDGVFLNGSLAVAFNPNQIKLTTNKKPTINSDIRYALDENAESRRNKPIAGQMDMFSAIIGAEHNTQTEAWDSNYKKQATANADSIIKLLQERGYEQISNARAENDSRRGRSDTGRNGKRSGMLDLGAVRRIFESAGTRTSEESKLYSRVVRELGGYSIQTPKISMAWKFGVIKDEFFTYDMLRIADVNKANGVGTVFYLDSEIYKNGRQQGRTAGLFFRGGKNVYVSALLTESGTRIPFEVKKLTNYGRKTTYYFDYLNAWGKDGKYVATRGENNQSRTTMRHERLHLVYDAESRGLSTFSQDTYNAVNALKRFVRERFAGKADDFHRSIKDYYVNELGYGKVEAAIEEIACDLYCEDLILNNEIEQAEARKLLDDIDKTLNGVVGKDGVRYAINQDTNTNPTESDNSGTIGGLTRGQRAKFVANNTRFKVYSKSDAASVIDAIIAERLASADGSYDVKLSGKSRAEVIERLFTKLNNTPEGYRLGVALNIADYMINNAVLTEMYDTYNDDSYTMGVLSMLRGYMHRMDLSGIQSEIQHKFDKKNSINLVWGAKKNGLAPDVVAQELEGYGIRFESINAADQFFEMLELYERARQQVNKKAESIMLTAYGTESEIERLRQEIARDVLNAYDEKGTPSKFAKLVEKYTKKIASLKTDLSTAYKRNTLINRIIDGAAYLRDVATKRNYVGAEIFSAPELTAWLKQLSKIKYCSDMRKSGVRKILLDYGQFYNTNNALLYDDNPDLNHIDENVIDALNFIRQNALSNKPLSMEELQAAQVIIASAKHLFNTYDQITIEGKKQKISALAAEGNEIIQKNKNRTSKGFFNRIYGVFNKIIEPRVVIKSLENFNPNGILTRAYNEVTRGETEAGLLYIELTNDIDTYIKKHKHFKKRLASEYITIAGHELTVGQAISLYELSKRPQAQEGLYESGFSYIDKKGSKQTVRITESDITAMFDAFTDTDKGFIELVETFFNVASKQVKTDADIEILGYTNASDEFYFPIKRDSGTIAKNITDARSIMADWANVYNFSFNKDVRTGAKNKLFVTDVYSVITRHAKQLSTYARMTVPLKNFSQIYAKNIGDKTNVVSIRNTINEQVWGGAEGYLSKLFSDIQGRATSSSVIEKMRGAYAKYQLGANLKVIVSQITSYPTAGVLLDTGVMAKGFVMRTNWAAMDKYCPYARVRNYERGIVRAEGVVDKVGKVGDVLTKPIQWTDRFTIGRLWNACQLQIQKDTGAKYGTVANMQKAGALLEDVIRLTQPNYTNTERSELMRSDSDIVRSFTMFTSVPLKQLSRLVESFGEYNALRSLVKTDKTDAALAKRYKLAKKKLRRTLAAVTVANLMYVLVGQFFKFLYNNMAEDEKEGKVTAKSFFLDMLNDFGSTTIGMLPVVRDIYGYFANGYEINSFTGDMLNGILSTTKQLFELAQKSASGEEIKTQDYMSVFRNAFYGIGQITGIPIRNINNTITGLVKRFNTSAAYSYTSLFYNHKYSTDIKAALKKGDYELAETIMGMMLKDDRTGGLNEKATKKLIELYDAGYAVLPKSVGDTLTYNGQEIQLTAAQQNTFKAIYSQANAEIERTVNSMAFATLPADKQAKAIKLIYDAYYSKAQSVVLKTANSNKIIMLGSAIPPSALAPHLAAISAIESDTDKSGNVVKDTKKAKIIKYVMAQKLTTPQKLLLILSLGYSIKDGDIRGVSATKAKNVVARYITNLSLTREEKTALAEKCGLKVKNGRIYAA